MLGIVVFFVSILIFVGAVLLYIYREQSAYSELLVRIADMQSTYDSHVRAQTEYQRTLEQRFDSAIAVTRAAHEKAESVEEQYRKVDMRMQVMQQLKPDVQRVRIQEPLTVRFLDAPTAPVVRSTPATPPPIPVREKVQRESTEKKKPVRRAK